MGSIIPAAKASIASRAAADILDSLPRAMGDEWMRGTWTGVHGRAGLRAEIESTTTTARLLGHDVEAQATAEGVVRTADGEDIGEVMRGVYLDKTDGLSVEHSLLELEPEAQGTGFARSFNDHAFERYAEAGIDKVRLYAALDVGGYAWARQGFELAVDGADEGERMLKRAMRVRSFVRRAVRKRSVSAEQAFMLRNRVWAPGGDLGGDTITSVQTLAALPDDVGRKVLLGQSWRGERPIDASEHWTRTLGAGPARDADHAVRLLHEAVPEQLRPEVIADAVERATASRVVAAPDWREVEARVGTGSSPWLSVTTHFDLVDELAARRPPTLRVTVEENHLGQLEVSEVLDGVTRRLPVPRRYRRGLDRAWAELGIESRRTSVRQLRRPVSG